MAFDKLPEEILVRILSFLPRSDLLESALTCRRWAQAVAGPPLLRNVWLVIRDMTEAGTIFANTRRQYENLRLCEEDLRDFDVAFWSKVGPSLRKLEIIYCWCSSEVFYSILQTCCNLESLKLEIRCFKLCKPELASGINVRSVQESMCKLHHLHLDLRFSRIEILEYLLGLMPNVSSIGLLLYEVESNLLSRLPKILGTSRRITKLELSSKPITSSASLREIESSADSPPPTPRTFEALEYCTMLRDLRIECWVLGAALLQKILGYVPQLEFLRINHIQGPPFTRGDLMPLFDLKKLRDLDLGLNLESDSRSCISEELLRELARMLSLETLAVRNGFVNSTGFRILASLPKLRNLNLRLIKWDAESLRIILFELRKLRTLSIWVDSSRGCTHSWLAGDSEVDPQSLAFVDRFGSDRQDELESSSLEVLKFLCGPLTDAGLSQIAAHHTRLKALCLESCDVITDAGLVTLLQHEPLLEQLELHGNNHLNGEFLEALGELPCRRLRSLTVYTRAAISSQAREAFQSRKPRVECRFIP